MPKVTNNTRSRSWVFTINNWTDEDVLMLRALAKKARYLLFGYETAPTTGTPHLQGYVYFTTQWRFNRVRKIFGTNHIEDCKGTPEQNHVYCTKDKKFEEFGKLPTQGARNDLECFVEQVETGETRLDETTLLTQYSSIVARYPQFVDRVQNHFHPPQPLEQLNNFWYYGAPGTGKTVSAQRS